MTIESPVFRGILGGLVLFLALTMGFVSRSQMASEIHLSREKEPLLVPPAQLEHFTFGYKELISDLLWLRAIQAFDFCGGTFVSDETATYGGTRTVHLCEKGWVFQMLDAATRISPRYRIIYTRGAVNLSVAVNDRLGAQELYLRGMKAFPQHWGIHFQAGYHEIFEMGNPDLAAKYFDVAGRNGAPPWLPLLAAQLYNKAGQAELGMRALADLYHDKELKDWPIRARDRWAELEKGLGRTANPSEFYTPTN